jgi:hypothetical protein
MKTKPKSIAFLVPLLLVLSLIALAACAPNTNSTKTGTTGEQQESTDATQPVGITYSADTDCTACHTPETESYEATAFLASQHKGSDCLSCHDDLATLTGVHDSVHVGDKTASRLKKTSVSDELCLSCHPGDDRITATAGLTVLTDKEGTVVNPHDLADNKDHQGIACADCHKMHKEEPIATTAKGVCIGCHHQDVFTCYTCHD